MKTPFVILALGFALAINGVAHGTGWVITQVAHQLGITKDWMELTPSDIDKLSNKQACGLAKIEREMWGSGADEFRRDEDKNKGLAAIKTKSCREFLKQASVIFGKMDLENEDPSSFRSFRLFYLVRDKDGIHGPSKVDHEKPYEATVEAPSENAVRCILLRDVPNAVQIVINDLGLVAPSQDTAFFSGVHLGMTIDEARKQKAENVWMFWHSDAPTGQERVEFRTDTSPQRRIYVHYLQADNKIVSVLYWKLGEGETFTKAERNHLIKLSGNREQLTVTTFADGSEFEVTTPNQLKIEAANP